MKTFYLCVSSFLSALKVPVTTTSVYKVNPSGIQATFKIPKSECITVRDDTDNSFISADTSHVYFRCDDDMLVQCKNLPENLPNSAQKQYDKNTQHQHSRATIRNHYEFLSNKR
jgi:D-hexose-6-phosphate mutarotase